MNGCRHKNGSPTTGAGSSELVSRSTSGQFSLSYSLYEFFLPGNVALVTSSLNLTQGLSFISTSLKTQPRAGCF